MLSPPLSAERQTSKRSRMKRRYIKILLLVVIILIIVPLYILVQGYVARYLPTFLITSKTLSLVSAKGRFAVTIIGSELVGSLIVAFVTLLPVGYMFPKR
jgi:ABC-type phosphate transport system permease subunit